MKVIVIRTSAKQEWYYYHFHQIQVILFINSLRTWVAQYFLIIPHLQKNSTICETNYCHLFAANAQPPSARVKQVESLKIVSVDLKPPEEKPPGYKHRYKPLVISLPNICSPVISPLDITPLDINPPYISPSI